MAGRLIGLGAYANGVGTYGNGTHLGLNGLSPSDPCYDPAAYSWWNSSSECACMAAHPDLYSFGQQCASFTPSGIAKAFTYSIGQAAGGIVSGATAGVTSGAVSQLDLSGYLGIGVLLLVGTIVLSRVL